MTKNNYFHMKLREHREEILRLKEELEASARAALERESATAGMAAEQIEHEKAAARVERERVLTQLESAEADRDEVFFLLGSSGYYEIAAQGKSAAFLLNLAVGARVELEVI